MEILPKKGKSGRKRRRKGGGRGRRRNVASLGGLVVACALALLGFALVAANVQGVFAKAIDPALARALPELHGHMTYSPDVSLSLSGALELRDVKVDFDRPGDRYARLTKARRRSCACGWACRRPSSSSWAGATIPPSPRSRFRSSTSPGAGARPC